MTDQNSPKRGSQSPTSGTTDKPRDARDTRDQGSQDERERGGKASAASQERADQGQFAGRKGEAREEDGAGTSSQAGGSKATSAKPGAGGPQRGKDASEDRGQGSKT